MSNKHSRAAMAARHRRNMWLIWGGVAVVAVLAVVIAVVASSGGGGDSGSGSNQETAPVTVDGTALPSHSGASTDAAVGKTIPTLTGATLDGTPIEIRPNGTPQLLVFLAHWCPHCQVEVPRIVSLADDGVLDGVDVTAIATGTNADAPNYPPSSWLEREDWPFPVMADSEGFDASKAFGLSSYPYLVFVDGDGKVVGRASGEISSEDLAKMIEALKDGEPIPGVAPGASSSAK
jgi:thiol-disulfide isomerase/thioredoxin